MIHNMPPYVQLYYSSLSKKREREEGERKGEGQY